MMRTRVFVLLVFVAAQTISGEYGPEVLDNPDFEDTSGIGKWKGNQCSLELIQNENEAHSGSYFAKITGRTQRWAGIGQADVTVVPSTTYVFQAYIKLTNLKEGFLYHEVQVVIRSTLTNGNFAYDIAAIQPQLRPEYGWTEIGADYKTRADVTKIQVYIQIEEPEVNYYFDTASFKELLPDVNWEQNANNYIDNWRKASLTVKLTDFTGSSSDLDGLTVKVEHLRNNFPFGSAVGAKHLVDPQYANYSKFFYDNFEWATLENALKWKQMERTQGEIDYETPMAAITDLRQHGVPIRGHNVFWGVEKYVPDWVKNVPTEDMTDLLKKRVKDVVESTNLLNWDVNNEVLHGDYFEQRLNNPDITMDMFQWVKNSAPNAKLFLNDFQIANAGTYTTAYKNQGKRFKEAGAPISFLGIQSHFSNGNIDMTSLKYRIDKAAESGLLIWITELSINETNVQLKAQALRNVLTLYFGHPKIRGIVFWGFWDQKIWRPAAALATGNNVEPNEAGLVYQELRNKWKTNESFDLKDLSSGEKVLRVFKGKFKISVLNGNVKVHEEEIWVRGNAGNLDISWVNVQK